MRSRLCCLTALCIVSWSYASRRNCCGLTLTYGLPPTPGRMPPPTSAPPRPMFNSQGTLGGLKGHCRCMCSCMCRYMEVQVSRWRWRCMCSTATCSRQAVCSTPPFLWYSSSKDHQENNSRHCLRQEQHAVVMPIRVGHQAGNDMYSKTQAKPDQVRQSFTQQQREEQQENEN